MMIRDASKVHKRAAWMSEPATAKQRKYLENIGIPHSPFITKGQAGVLISIYQQTYPRATNRIPSTWLKDVTPRGKLIETWTCGLCNIKVKNGCHCPLCGAFEEGRCIICGSDHYSLLSNGVCDKCLDCPGPYPIVLTRLERDTNVYPLGESNCCYACISSGGSCACLFLSDLLKDLSPEDQESALHDKDIVKILLKNRGIIHPIICLNFDTPRKAIESGVKLAGFIDGEFL